RAQDDLDDDNEVEANAAGMVFMRGNQPGVEQFEQWVFNQMGGAGIARNRLNAALELHIDEINRFCGINEAQKRKLQLAGRGDIKRFFDRVDEAKRRYMLVMNDQNHNIWEDVQPLQSMLGGGIFGDESIFAKTVKKTLSNDQSATLAEQERQRNKHRYLITIDWFITHVDKGLGMTAEQRKRLSALLKETRPPRRFGSSDYYYLMYRAGLIPEERIKPIFDDIQWRVFSQQINQGRGMQQWLKNNGMIEDEPVAGNEGKNLAEAAKADRKAAARPKAIKAEAKKRDEGSHKE
ncbi:MAG TPA: hypothetical protein VKA15_13735, partial [Isosphaeraceae bacterium]|nr:hypothetical protein [Isosphaeraceae bacterium]